MRIGEGICDPAEQFIQFVFGASFVIHWRRAYITGRKVAVIKISIEYFEVEVWALGGSMGRVRPEATAFYHREAPFLLTFEANAEDPATDEANIAWVRRRFDQARRFSRAGTYLNFGGFWEGGEELLAQSYGTNYPRLREVKKKYDPESVFNRNLRIQVSEEALRGGREGLPAEVDLSNDVWGGL